MKSKTKYFHKRCVYCHRLKIIENQVFKYIISNSLYIVSNIFTDHQYIDSILAYYGHPQSHFINMVERSSGNRPQYFANNDDNNLQLILKYWRWFRVNRLTRWG